MPITDSLDFLTSMGPAFGGGFIGLTGVATYQFLQARDLATQGIRAAAEASRAALTPPVSPPGDEECPAGDPRVRAWERLSAFEGSLEAAVSRAHLTTGAIPTLALLGTCLGFFYAISNAGSLELGSSDPLELLDALMDGGVSTALATTVCGQALYLVLGQVWSLFVAGRVEDCSARLHEGLALLRERIGEEVSP